LLSFKYMTKKIILAALILGIGVMVMGAVLMFGSTAAVAAEAGVRDRCIPETTCRYSFDGRTWNWYCVEITSCPNSD